jgi:hypothetical protein
VEAGYNFRVRLAGLALAALAALSVLGIADAAPERARLTVAPPAAIRGDPILISGQGFRARLKVTVSLRRSTGRTWARLGVVRAGRTGAFSLAKTVSPTTAVGAWIARACQLSCRVRATKRFYVIKIKPV